MTTYLRMSRLGYTTLQRRVGAGLPAPFGAFGDLAAFGATMSRGKKRPNVARAVAQGMMRTGKPAQKVKARPAPKAKAKATGLTAGASSVVPGSLGARARTGISPSTWLGQANAPTHLSIEMLEDSPFGTPSYGPLVGPRPPAVVKVMTGVSGLDGTDGFLSVITGALKKVVPKHTIVGKLLGGDVGGAVKGAVKEVAAKNVKKPAAPIAPTQVEPSTISVTAQSLVPQNTAQKWMLAGAAVLGAGLLFLIVRRGMGGGRRLAAA